MSTDVQLFLVLVFVTVVLLTYALATPVLGADASSAKKTRARVRNLTRSMSTQSRSLLRERYLKDLSPLERTLENLPFMEPLAKRLEQAGIRMPAYRFVLISAAFGFAALVLVTLLTFNILFGLLGAGAAMLFAFGEVARRRARRLAAFEEQLPEALTLISRALRAGLPFNDALNIAGSELANPIGEELTTTFADLNYGISMRDGFLNLMTRVPSISLNAVVTAVLIQKETGGNLAEVLDKIEQVVRSRFRLQRRIKTLSAEGRMSAWVLGLIPFVLAGVLFITSPSYLPRMLEDELGRDMILFAFFSLVVGIFWIRRIIRIRV